MPPPPILELRRGRYFIGNISFHDGVVYPNVKAFVYRDDPYPYYEDPIVVGVFGSAGQGYDGERKEFRDAAFEIGREIAKYRGDYGRRMVLLNGACPGLPHFAAKGAREESGFIVGITAADSYETHRKLLSLTLKGGDEEVRKLVKEQEEIYNIIVFPPYTLPKNVVKLLQERLLLSYLDSKWEEGSDSSLRRDVISQLKRIKHVLDINSDVAKNMLKWRNPLNTELSDVCIGIAGSAGTLSELAMAYHPNHSIIGLYSPNQKQIIAGIEAGRLHTTNLNTVDLMYLFHYMIGRHKNEYQSVVYHNDPKEIVSKVAEEWTKRYEFIARTEISAYIPDTGVELARTAADLSLLTEICDRYHPSMERPLRKKIIEPIIKEIKNWTKTEFSYT